MTDQYAVFGNPIAQSRSPEIHAAFARQTGEDMDYRRQLVEVDGFAAAADEFFAGGGKGINITIPFKQDAYTYAARLTPRARRAGAVNTLTMQTDHAVMGDTTDGIGLVTDITVNLGWQLRGADILILGAGGAVRGVLENILAEQPGRLVIANRTPEKALQLARGFADLGGPVAGCGFGDLSPGGFDLVINGTSAGLTGELPPLPDDLLAPGAHCYDMVYGHEPTPFQTWSRQQGAVDTADGLGMLVEQAAASFAIWRGKVPRTREVIAGLRESLAK